jgi:UPF0755 protein
VAAKKRKPAAPRKSRPPKGDGARDPMAAAKWTAFLMVVAAGLLYAALVFWYPTRHGPGSGREVELVLMGDESPEALTGKLSGGGLVADPRLFAWYVRATGAAGKVAKGVHLFTDDMTPRELLTRAEKRGAASRVKVTIPEGFTSFDIGKRLQEKRVCAKRAFLDATRDPNLLAQLRIEGPSAEGYLFPLTYDLPQDSLPEDVVRRMKAEFDKRWSTLEERHASGILDLSESLKWGMREIVILASMVEKEAVMDDERPVIASVFLNRLRDPKFTSKLLQCDPTAGYGCLVDPAQSPVCSSYTGKITHDVVSDPNPYNTYKHEGLPPGPIANPGTKSIEGVMAASQTHYLYFVAKGGGRHHFSETYGSHAAAIEESKHR